MSLADFKSAPLLRPMLNIGFPWDMYTGRYYKGKNGENILNGGLAPFSGVAGLPNMFKTVISLYQLGAAMDNYACAVMAAHDAENTLSVERIHSNFMQFNSLSGVDLILEERLFFSDATVYMGNEWFADLKTYSKKRRGDMKNRVTTPFYNHRSGEFLKVPSPTLSFLDSLSGLQTDSTQTMFDKTEIGESGLNMLAMKASGAKSQMIEQMTSVTAPAGIFALQTAHIGEKPQLDQYKPNVKKLKFLKGDLNLKRVPENFSFLTGNCWYCANLSTMIGDDKLPEFPRDADDDLKGDTDLICITVINLRGKFGPSGIPVDIIVSQLEGVKVGLTEYCYIKSHNYFGLQDKDGKYAKGAVNYRLALAPDVSMNRKTIREKIEENAELKRALTITAEMCWMKNHWHQLEHDLFCTPAELYEQIKAKGYDWSILLNTRGFWTFQEDKHPLNFLSTKDLLEMRVGRYHPAWYPKSAKELGITLSNSASAEAPAPVAAV